MYSPIILKGFVSSLGLFMCQEYYIIKISKLSYLVWIKYSSLPPALNPIAKLSVPSFLEGRHKEGRKETFSDPSGSRDPLFFFQGQDWVMLFLYLTIMWTQRGGWNQHLEEKKLNSLVIFSNRWGEDGIVKIIAGGEGILMIIMQMRS